MPSYESSFAAAEGQSVSESRVAWARLLLMIARSKKAWRRRMWGDAYNGRPRASSLGLRLALREGPEVYHV